MKDPKALPPAIQGKLFDMLRGAHAGDAALQWLNGLVQRAGYAKFDGAAGALLVTARQLEALLELSTRSVRALIADGMPCAKPGVGSQPSLFDLGAVLRWHRRREAESDRGESAMEQLREEQRRAAKRKNDLEDGLLVETEVVGRILREAFATWREQVKVLEVKHGVEVGAAVRNMIDTAFKGAAPVMPEARA